MKSSFQIYPPTINLWVTWIELFIVNASTATYRARTENQNATEVLIQIPNLNDRLIPKIQSDEDKIRKVKTEIETKNLASAPTGVDLDSFRGEIEQALRSDLQIQKTALSSLIHRIDVTQDGEVGVEFYINTRALDNTPYPICSRYEFETFSRG